MFFLKKAENIEMLRAFDHIYGITGRLELIMEFLDVFYWSISDFIPKKLRIFELRNNNFDHVISHKKLAL